MMPWVYYFIVGCAIIIFLLQFWWIKKTTFVPGPSERVAFKFAEPKEITKRKNIVGSLVLAFFIVICGVFSFLEINSHQSYRYYSIVLGSFCLIFLIIMIFSKNGQVKIYEYGYRGVRWDRVFEVSKIDSILGVKCKGIKMRYRRYDIYDYYDYLCPPKDQVDEIYNFIQKKIVESKEKVQR